MWNRPPYTKGKARPEKGAASPETDWQAAGLISKEASLPSLFWAIRWVWICTCQPESHRFVEKALTGFSPEGLNRTFHSQGCTPEQLLVWERWAERTCQDRGGVRSLWSPGSSSQSHSLGDPCPQQREQHFASAQRTCGLSPKTFLPGLVLHPQRAFVFRLLSSV